MHRDARAYLWDVLQAAEAIQRFIGDRDLEAFAQNELLHAAVERKFEIVGEALGRLSKENPDIAHRIPNIRDIIAFRNILIHGYAVIDHTRVWRIAATSLPGLRDAVASLLDELGQPDA
jgi:uncharacterized protein with HEPN domain